MMNIFLFIFYSQKSYYFLLRNYFVWLRITDEGSVPEMRIWFILLIKFDLKWCIHLNIYTPQIIRLQWNIRNSLANIFQWKTIWSRDQNFDIVFFRLLGFICRLRINSCKDWSTLFSAPEPKAQVHYCDHVLSVVRPVLTFHIFDFSSETTEQNSTKLDRKKERNILYQVCVFWVDRKNKMATLASDWLRHFRLLLWNRWTELNETWQEARSQRPLSICVFRTDRKNKMAALASDWLRHFRLLLWNHSTEFNETWQEARSQRPLPSLCFSGRSEKQDGCPGLWLAETFSTSSETAERNSTKLDRKQDLNVLYQVYVFRADRKNKMAALVSDWLGHFGFSFETAEQNSTKLDRNHDLNVLYQVCVFRADRKNKMAALASDWLRHFSTSPLKPLNRIQRNLTGRKNATSSTKFVFFGSIGKTRWPPWPLIGWDIFDFFSETAEQN